MNRCGFHSKQWDWYLIVHLLRQDWKAVKESMFYKVLHKAIRRCAKKTGTPPSKINGELLADWLAERSR